MLTAHGAPLPPLFWKKAIAGSPLWLGIQDQGGFDFPAKITGVALVQGEARKVCDRVSCSSRKNEARQL
jgi:hypothetical protein